MKNVLASIVFICLLGTLGVGCGGGAYARLFRYDSTRLNQQTDKILIPAADGELLKLRGKSVYISHTYEPGNGYVEDYIFASKTVTRKPYGGNFPQDVVDKLKSLMRFRYGMVVKPTKDEADLVIDLNFAKYFCQVLEANITGAKQFKKTGAPKLWKINIRTLLKVEYEIQSLPDRKTKDTYGHLITTKTNREEKVLNKKEYHMTEKISNTLDDDQLISRLLSSVAVKNAVFRPGMSTGIKIDHFHPETGDKINTVQLTKDDISGFGQVKDPVKRTYMELFGQTPGPMVYLIYDFMGEIAGKCVEILGDKE